VQQQAEPLQEYGQAIDDAGWDSDPEPVVSCAPSAGYVVPHDPVHQLAHASAGWDDPPTQQQGKETITGSTCGAPPRPTQAFVAAGPRKTAAAAESSGNDLDDLVGEMLAAGKDSHGASFLVPDFQCTGCDFQILCIEDFVWRDDVEYMFFRNGYPTVSKLRSGMQSRKGCRAYCCQCSWRSADRMAELDDVAAGLRWRLIASDSDAT
jgi:hypothetical protein